MYFISKSDILWQSFFIWGLYFSRLFQNWKRDDLNKFFERFILFNLELFV